MLNVEYISPQCVHFILKISLKTFNLSSWYLAGFLAHFLIYCLKKRVSGRWDCICCHYPSLGFLWKVLKELFDDDFFMKTQLSFHLCACLCALFEVKKWSSSHLLQSCELPVADGELFICANGQERKVVDKEKERKHLLSCFTNPLKGAMVG